MKAGKYEYFDWFVTEYKDEISDIEFDLIQEISAELGFEYINVAKNGSISIFTTKESRLENKWGLDGVQDWKFRGLFIRK